MLVLILEKYILKRGCNYKMACERIDFLGVPIDILKEAIAKNKPLEQVPEDMWKLIEF